MARNRIIYNIEDIFVGPEEANIPILSYNSQILQRILRVTSFDYSFDVNRTEIKELGRRGCAAKPIIDSPRVSFSFGYNIANVANEAKLGFNVNYALSGNGSLYTGYRSLISGFANNDRTHDKRNFYLVVGNSGQDIHSNANKRYTGNFLSTFVDPYSSNYNVITFINSYLDSYRVDASVGDFPRAALTYNADSAAFYNSGSGIPVLVLHTQSGILQNSDVKFYLPTAFQENAISVLRPGDITISINKSGAGQPDNLWVDFSDLKFQSFSLDVGLPRQRVSFLGNKYPTDSPIVFPVYGDLSLSALVGDTSTGNLANLFNADENYNILIKITNPLANQPANQGFALRYDLFNAKFEKMAFQNSIGANVNAAISFRVDIDPDDVTKGLFVSGVITNPDIYSDSLLTEDGYYITTEDGYHLVTEDIVLGPTVF